jgi:hypothetical protein
MPQIGRRSALIGVHPRQRIELKPGRARGRRRRAEHPGLVGGLRSARVADRPSSANPVHGVEDEVDRQSTRDLARRYG